MKGDKFIDLVALVDRLRGPQGCPWDREQTFETLKPLMLEEAYEVLDALDSGNRQEFCAELGDLLFQVAFLSQMAEEEGSFTIDEVAERIIEKMVRRHPHIFGEVKADTSQQVITNWELIKQAERADKQSSTMSDAPTSVLANVPRMSALLTASKLTSKAARVGFDWSHVDQIVAKLHEEIEELKHALARAKDESAGEQVEAEVGDLLFVVVNIARFLKIDPETALRRTNQKFVRRFQYIEQSLREVGKDINACSLEEMDLLWEEAKKLEVE